MVVTLYGCYERTYPLFSQASLFVWHDGACAVIWRIAIILQSLLCCSKLETTFCFSLTLLVPVFFLFFSADQLFAIPVLFLPFCHAWSSWPGVWLFRLLESWDLPVGSFTVGKLYSGAIYSCGFVRWGSGCCDCFFNDLDADAKLCCFSWLQWSKTE